MPLTQFTPLEFSIANVYMCVLKLMYACAHVCADELEIYICMHN